MIDNVGPLKKALYDKGSAYGLLDLPYVVALGPSGETVTWESRAPDGYWFGGTEWKHRNVSGVLIAHSLQPWTISIDVPTLWEHPDPARSVDPPPMWRRAVASEGKLEYVDAQLLPSDLFGLPPEWPGSDPFEPYAEGT
jgi:hypothetical protein